MKVLLLVALYVFYVGAKRKIFLIETDENLTEASYVQSSEENTGDYADTRSQCTR